MFKICRAELEKFFTRNPHITTKDIMKTNKPTSIITSIMFLAISVGHADSVVYQNDFENGAGSAWSSSSIAVAAG